MNSIEEVGCCGLTCSGIEQVLKDDEILIPFSSPEMSLRCSRVEQFVNVTDCDELLGCVDRRTSCDGEISHSLEGRLSVVLVSD